MSTDLVSVWRAERARAVDVARYNELLALIRDALEREVPLSHRTIMSKMNMSMLGLSRFLDRHLELRRHLVAYQKFYHTNTALDRRKLRAAIHDRAARAQPQ